MKKVTDHNRDLTIPSSSQLTFDYVNSSYIDAREKGTDSNYDPLNGDTNNTCYDASRRLEASNKNFRNCNIVFNL